MPPLQLEHGGLSLEMRLSAVSGLLPLHSSLRPRHTVTLAEVLSEALSVRPRPRQDRLRGGKRRRSCVSFISSSFSFVFLGEVPWLGVELNLYPPAYTTAIAMQDPSQVCDLHHRSQQRRIPDPLSQARD